MEQLSFVLESGDLNLDLSGSLLFAELQKIVQTKPKAQALGDSASTISFEELSEGIKSCSQFLMGLQEKFGNDSYIPLLVSRDLDSAILILSALSFGIPFSPIDADWSQERVVGLLDAMGSPGFMVIGRDGLDKASKKFGALAVIVPYSHKEKIQNHLTLKSLRGSTRSGFVLFTSGTTGKPKGVVYDSKGIEEKFFSRQKKESELTPSPRPPSEIFTVLAYPLNFGAGINILLRVLVGTRIRIVSSEEMAPDSFIQLVKNLAPNRISAPPSLFVLLSNIAARDSKSMALPSVEEVIMGGDAVSFSTTSRLKRIFNAHCLVSVGFGATEAVGGITFKFALGDSPDSGPMPIGPSQAVSDNQLLPLESSEDHFVLLLESSVHYLGDERLTAERFIVTADGRRLWRSGDVVYRDPEGLLWHKGREDDLVKIRGKLTSPSEATSLLLTLKGVEDAITLASTSEQVSQLMAHIQLNPGAGWTSRALRRELARSLPAHLIPHKIMVHEALPRNDRGKPDRQHLLAMDFVEFRDTPIRPPLTQIEVILLNAARIVLGAENLSVDDHLVEFGMDSLAALAMETVVQEDFPLVTLDLISQYPSVEKLADFLADSPIGKLRQDGEYNPFGSKPIVFAFPGGGNRLAHFANLAYELGSDQPLLAFRYNDADLSSNNTTIEGQAERAFSIVSKAPKEHQVKIIGYSAGGIPALELARKCIASGRRVHLTILDSGIGLMRRKQFTLTEKSRKDRYTKDKPSLFEALVRGVKRQGLARSLRILILEKPLESAISYLPLRRIIVQLFSYTHKSAFLATKRRLVQLLIDQSRREYSAGKLIASQEDQLSALYFYVESNTSFKEWSELIPRIKFIPVPGKHGDMLQPPHLKTLAEALVSDWNHR